MRRTRALFSSTLLALLAFATTSLVALAVPPLPHTFFGSITAGGAPVTRGATLQAFVRGTLCGSATINTAGQYSIDVRGDDPDNPSDVCQATSGDPITFRLSYGGSTQNLSPTGANWSSGQITNLNLAFPSALPTPTPTLTPSPTRTPTQTSTPTNTPIASNTPTRTPTPVTVRREFRGTVFNEPFPGMSNPQPGVRVALYGSNNPNVLGVLLRDLPLSGTAPDAGQFNLRYDAGSGATDYLYYNLVVEDAAWQTTAAQAGPGATVPASNPTWIQYQRPAGELITPRQNFFWVRSTNVTATATASVTASASATASATASPTVSTTPGSGTPTPTASPSTTVSPTASGTATPTGTATSSPTVTPTGTATSSPTVTPTTSPLTPTPTRGPGLGWLSGRLWEDRDRDKVQDPDEPGISGVEVWLERPDGTVLRTTLTGENGFYLFPNIPLDAGDQFVVVAPAIPGYEATDGTRRTVRLSAAVTTSASFPYVRLQRLYLPLIFQTVGALP